MQQHITSHDENNRYDVILDRLLALIQEGVPQWEPLWVDLKTPRNLFTRKPYIGIQAFVLEALGYKKQLFLTEDQLRFMGGSLKPGESAHEITARALQRPADLRLSLAELPIVHSEKIINIEQCQGIPPHYLKPFECRDNIGFPECEKIVAGMRNPPEIVHKGDDLKYNVLKDCINIPPRAKFLSSAGYYHGLFHTLITSTAHPNRLKRSSLATPLMSGSKEHFEEELIGEVGAAFLSDNAGIFPAIIRNCASYIGGIIDLSGQVRVDIDVDAVFDRAVQATKYILGK